MKPADKAAILLPLHRAFDAITQLHGEAQNGDIGKLRRATIDVRRALDLIEQSIVDSEMKDGLRSALPELSIYPATH